MTKQIKIGNVTIGGGNPVAIQSMTNTKTQDADKTTAQIEGLRKAGCEIVRVAVKDEADAQALKIIRQAVKIPIVADIHFDFRLAISAIENGADKIRINPGNIGSEEKVKAVADAAKAHRIPIRVGVNGGSLEKNMQKNFGSGAEALAGSAVQSVALLERLGFYDIVVSVKSSDVKTSIEANTILGKTFAYPLHLGITEAGTFRHSLIKSSIGIGSLLAKGIGDTIRVSVTGDPLQEIAAAQDILRALGLRKDYVEIISCPTCGRCEIDLERVVNRIEAYTKDIRKPLTVAIMGCVVNGVGEGINADIGLAGGKDCGVLFENGKILKKVAAKDMEAELIRLIDQKTGNIGK